MGGTYKNFVKKLQGLLGNEPEEKKENGHLGPDCKHDLIEIALNKMFYLFSPDHNHCANEKEAKKSCYEYKKGEGKKS